MVPETKYTKSGNVNIAYQVVGDGPIDLVLVPGWISNIDVFWEEPSMVRFLNKLASFSRLILFDKRGTGLSDRVTRIASLAGSEQILVSRTVKDLVAGSGIEFKDFGIHPLKGVPDHWNLFEVI